MKSLEMNKIAGAILLAGIIGMVSGKVTEALYHPDAGHGEAHIERGYVIEGAETEEAVHQEESVEIDIMTLIAQADAEKGKVLSKKCVSCHSFEEGGPHKVGPNLWNILERDIASSSGFGYSSALQDKPGTWDYAALDGFLESPRKWANGTKMAFAGLRKPEERAAMIAYLRTLSHNPIALPAAAEPPAHASSEEEHKAEKPGHTASAGQSGDNENQAEQESSHSGENTASPDKVEQKNGTPAAAADATASPVSGEPLPNQDTQHP